MTMVKGERKTRILLLLAKKISLLSNLFFLVGLVWVLSFPLVSKKTYLSENALIPSQSVPGFSQKQTKNALILSNQITEQFHFGKANALNFIDSTLRSYGLETQRHPFSLVKSYTNGTIICNGTNLYATLAAPKGAGKESIVISAPLDPKKCDNMGLSLSLMQYFTTVKWLHHDIVFVVSDSGCTGWDGEQAFVELTHAKPSATATRNDAFLHAGLMREAFVLDIGDFNLDYLSVLTEGINGELPNLDLTNTVVKRAEAEHLKVSLFKREDDGPGLDNTPLAKLARRMNISKPTVSQYYNFFKYLLHQFLGMQTGPHGWFRGYTIHAVTLTEGTVFPQKQKTQHRREENMRKIGRVVESSTRSMNNLIEELHQSFFLYFLDSPRSYIGHEDYIAPIWILVVPLIIELFDLYYACEKKNPLHSLSIVVLSVATGALLLGVPVALRSIMPLPASKFVIAWFSMCTVIVLGLFFVGFPYIDSIFANNNNNNNGNKKQPMFQWEIVKSFSLLLCSLLLAVLTTIQCSIAIVASVYFFIQSKLASPSRFKFILVIKFLLLLLISPPMIFMYAFVLSNMSNTGKLHVHDVTSVRKFMSWFESCCIVGDLYQNILFYSICLVAVPAYLCFVKVLWHLIRSHSPATTTTTTTTTTSPTVNVTSLEMKEH